MRGEWLIPPLALLAVMTVSGQDAGRPVQRANEQAPVFSSAAELVVVHVTVTDRRGAYVTGLSREAFRIVEDGTPQSIDLFTGEDSPVTVGLLVDSSGSMRQGRERVIAAATAFAEGKQSGSSECDTCRAGSVRTRRVTTIS
jgi:cobalamin biosynthesis protein CobT